MDTPRPQPSRGYRWAVLIAVSMAMFGNYYIYDSINPMVNAFKNPEGLFKFTDITIGNLNAYYSLAAVLTLLVSGIVIDKLGTKISIFLFSAICLVASLLMVVSPAATPMLVGRFLLGIGAESLIVAVTTALAKWFKGKELSFAFGVNLTIARLASVAADNAPNWAPWAFAGLQYPPYSHWKGPLWLGVGAGAICVIAALVYWRQESRAERRYQIGEAGATDKLELDRELFRFDASYWYIVALCVTFYSAIFPFRTFAVDYFIGAHGASLERASFLNSVLPLSAMVATPLFGLLSDKIGKRALLMTIGSALLVPVFLMMTYTRIDLLAPVVLMGIAFSLVPAVMWPSVAYLAPQARLGTAYALMTLLQQVGVWAMNKGIGYANEGNAASAQNPAGYTTGMWIFSMLGFVGLFFSYMLWRTERGPRAHGLETITTESKA